MPNYCFQLVIRILLSLRCKNNCMVNIKIKPSREWVGEILQVLVYLHPFLMHC